MATKVTRKPREKKEQPEVDLSWMIPENESGLGDVIEKFALSNRYDRGDAELSVTQLINSPQQVALEKQNEEAVKKESSGENIYAIMGKAVHHILEQAAPADSLVEERFFTIEDGVKISGAIDRVQRLPSGGYRVIDYKVMSLYGLKDGPKASFEWQLNMYAYMLEKIYKIKVEELVIVALLRDWSEKRKTPYAPKPIVFARIPLWTYAAREAFVKRRVMLHKEAQRDLEHGKLPHHCTPDETWDTDRAKAWYLDNGGKSKYYMDEPRKCENYCPVKKWCSQFLQWKLGTTFESEIANVGSSNSLSKDKGTSS